jgi:probable phosphoglycerate mutase
VHIEPGLRERCYGGFEGMLYSEIEQRFPAEFAAWQARDVDASFAKMEKIRRNFPRVLHPRHRRHPGDLAAAHPGRTLALVAHGGVLECAYRMALGLPLETPRDFKVYNASINRFRMEDGRLVLQSWGEVDTCVRRAGRAQLRS